MTAREIIRNFDKDELSKILNSSYSLAECLRRMGINHTQYIPDINSRVKKDKIKYKLLVRNSQPNLKVNYFKTINTKEKAYWLGFLAADGYITKNKVSLQLGAKDKEWLKKFVLDIGGSVDRIKIYDNNIHTNITKRYCYEFYNKDFCKHIIKHGFLSPKSHNLSLPKLNNKELDLAFLLGYFDGDGAERNTSVVSCSFVFLNQIKSRYKLKYLIKASKYSNNLYYLTLGSPLFRELLQNYKNSLIRKRKTYTPYIKKKPIGHIPRIIKLKIEYIPQIRELLKSEPLTFIGSQFNCSDNAIKKFCKKHKIKIPSFRRIHNRS